MGRRSCRRPNIRARKPMRLTTDGRVRLRPDAILQVARHSSQALNRRHSARILSMPVHSAIRGP